MQKTKKVNKHTLFIVFGLSLSLLNFIVFWLYINVDTVVSTFDVPKEFKEVYGSFYYYKTIFEDVFLGANAAYKGAFGHTMIAMLINVIIFPLALITAYAFYKRVYGEKFFRVVFYLPSIIAITTLAMCFRSLFLEVGVTLDGKDYMVRGPISSLMRVLGYKGDISLTVTDTPAYTTETKRSTTKYNDGYTISVASPKLKNRYPFSTAYSYTSKISSLPVRQATSIMRVLSGRWKLVTSASTHFIL